MNCSSTLYKFALLAALSAPNLSAQDAPNVVFEPYSTRSSFGQELEGQLGRIRVPENRFIEDGKEIEIAFVVYKTKNPNPGSPIMYLVGGPGGPGIATAADIATDPRTNLLESHDVIGLDQRGTGLSLPNLSQGPEFNFDLPLDRAVPREEYLAAAKDSAARCAEFWESGGVDLSAYNSVESAHDIDAVRQALGLDKIILWGSSYGSHLGLSYLRYHSEHVERSVLTKVEGPNSTFKLPSVLQRRLEGLHKLVAENAALSEQVPDLIGTVKALLAQLEAEPVTVTVDRGGREMSVTIGSFDLQMLISVALSSSNSLATLPKALYYMSQGEWRHVMGFVVGSRRGDLGSAMTLAMDCASGASPSRLAQIERERKDPGNLLSDAILAPFFPEVCEPCSAGDLGETFRGPIQSKRPILFVSGELDARTPVDNVLEILEGFPDHAHIIATNTGHGQRELESEMVRDLIKYFLEGGTIESCTVELPPVDFEVP